MSAAVHRADGKVEICHRAGAAVQTIVVAASAMPAHLAHGDTEGACTTPCACDDADLCTDDTCGADGSCHHVAVSCDDGNPCTAESCSPSTGCAYTPVAGAACDDSNECTTGDSCSDGACHGSAIAGCCRSDADCDDGNACTTDTCAGGACTNASVACAIQDPCLVAYCDPADGSCATAPVSCDDDVTCTVDSCDPERGCVHDTTACQVCGDGVRAGNEECDGADLGGFDCTDFHDTATTFFGGPYGLRCTDNCYLDLSLCARCGDGVADVAAEECDDTDLAGQTCQSLGFAGGNLSCNVYYCQFDTSACTP